MHPSVFTARSRFTARSSSWRLALPLGVAFTAFMGGAVAQPALPTQGAAPAQQVAGLAQQATAPLQAAQPQTPATLSITAQGTVRGPDGQAVRGAWVEAANIWGRVDPAHFQSAPVQTDANGRFAVEARFSAEGWAALRRWYKLGTDESSLVVGIYAPGYALTGSRLQASRAQGATLPANEVTLASGASVTGQIVDAQGAPAPNVPVMATLIRPLAGQFSRQLGGLALPGGQGFTPDGALARALSAVSGPDGRYTLHDLPVGAVNVMLTDTRYAQQVVTLTVAPNPARLTSDTTLTLLPGATVKGRVLYPDGKPVSNVSVRVRGDNGASRGMIGIPWGASSPLLGEGGMTQADGSFVIRGLDATQVTLAASAPTEEWAGASRADVTLKAGAETDVGDLKLVRGVLLTGYVREDETKAPIAGIVVNAAVVGGVVASAQTDAQGRYQLRTQAGNVAFSLEEPPSEYVRSFAPTQIRVGEDARTAPNIFLQRGATLKGTAKDEKGQPATGAIIDLEYGAGDGTQVDAQGNWTLTGIDSQFLKVMNEGPLNIQVSGSWLLLNPARPPLPQQAPIALTLRRVPLQTVKVRIVTPNGQPVAGAVVRSKFALDAEPTYQQFLSDAQGELTLQGLRADQALELTAAKQGYTLSQSSQVARTAPAGTEGVQGAATNPTVTRAPDIIMTPLSAKVAGRVVDAAGQPVGGARVALLFPNDLSRLPDGSVLTDAQGNFTLQSLPEGELVLGVAKGRAFGQSTAQGNGTVELKLGPEAPLHPPRDSEAAFGLLEQWLTDFRQNKGPETDKRITETHTAVIAALLARYDMGRAQRLMADSSERAKTSFASRVTTSWLGRDPQGGGAWAQTYLPLAGNTPASINIKLRVGILLAPVDLAAAQRLYDEVSPNAVPEGFDTAAGNRYAGLAALALATKNPDAEGWLQALTLCAQTPTEDELPTDWVGQWATQLAGADMAAARKWVAQLAPLQQAHALSALVTWVAPRNVALSRQLLGDLENLVAHPNFGVEAITPTRWDTYQQSVAELLIQVRMDVARALMGSDPQAAQTLARQLPENSLYNVSLRNEAPARAAGPQDADNMRALLHTAGTGSQIAVGELARIAAIVQDALPQVSAEGWTQARARLAEKSEAFGDANDQVPAYAYARAPFDPAESRLLLENAWSRVAAERAKAGPKEAEGVKWLRAKTVMALAAAMIPLDIARANAMISSLASSDGVYSEPLAVRSMMIKWLLADAKTRRAVAVDPLPVSAFNLD